MAHLPSTSQLQGRWLPSGSVDYLRRLNNLREDLLLKAHAMQDAMERHLEKADGITLSLEIIFNLDEGIVETK